MTLHFLNDILNDIKSMGKNDNYVIMASLKSEPTCKLINRIPGSRLLISNLPGSASIMHVESFDKLVHLVISISFVSSEGLEKLTQRWRLARAFSAHIHKVQ